MNQIITELDKLNFRRNQYNVYIIPNQYNGNTYITLRDAKYEYCLENGSGQEVQVGGPYDTFEQLWNSF